MDAMRWWMGPHRARGANSIEMRDRENAREATSTIRQIEGGKVGYKIEKYHFLGEKKN